MIAARAWMALAFALPSLVGTRLDDALSLLQRQGLTIVYSTALVKPEMRVVREPRSTTPRGVLDEILAPHGLRAVEGLHHELLVVAGPPPAPPPRSDPPPKARFGEEIVVTPGHARAVNQPAADSDSFPAAQLSGIPNPSGDATRAIQHLPGVTSAEASAAVGIRGGHADETIIAVDGLELSEPFHLKDFFNIFSTLDSTAMGRVDLMTGTFPAEWGDRIGGVVDMNLLTPTASESSSVAAGTLNGRITSTGSSPSGAASWLLSARGWYPDMIFSLDRHPNELVNADCYDLLGKLDYRLTSRTTASVSFLGSVDNLGYRNARPGETDRSAAEENSAHVWLTAQTKWSDAASVRTILATGRLWRERTGSIAGDENLDITDSRGFNFLELKQDWRAPLPDGQQLRFGFDARSSDARYDYTRLGDETRSLDEHLRPHERSIGLYVSDRIPLSSTAVAELGLRWDHQSLAGRPELSPRINVLWAVTPSTDLRAGWGRYYQSQRLNELQIEDGVTQLARPEMAEQRTVSIEHRFERGLTLRLEAFDKPMVDVRPRFENMLNPIDLFPEAQADRVSVAPSRSRARGVDLRLAYGAGGRTAWWASYARSRATDTIDSRDVPRSWDQPNAASGGVSIELAKGWSTTFTGMYHTGWPTTPVLAVRTSHGLDVAFGARNSERLPSWFRLDGRLSKSFRTQRGELSLDLDIMNLTNHDNVCCVSDPLPFVRSDGTLGVTHEDRSLVPFFPSLAVRWRF